MHRVIVVSLTFIIISSVFPWATASGLMIAKVQDFSDETAISREWCCQMLGSQHPSLRLSGGRPQGPCSPLPTAPRVPLPGLLIVSLQTWTLVEARVRLQTLTSTWLEGTETCKGHKPGKGGFGGWRMGRRSNTTQEQKPINN